MRAFDDEGTGPGSADSRYIDWLTIVTPPWPMRQSKARRHGGEPWPQLAGLAGKPASFALCRRPVSSTTGTVATMKLASTVATAAPITPASAFVSQLKGVSNPLGGDAQTSADCGVAASLMALWITGAQPRPTSASAVDQAFTSSRLLATGNADRTAPLFPSDVDRLLTKVQAPHTIEPSGTQLLEDVRRGATAVVFGSGTGATPRDAVGHADGAGTWYSRSAQLQLPGVPDGHAVTLTGYKASDDSFVVMDPLGQAPFRAPASEVSTFIDNLRSWGYPAGVTVDTART